MIRAVALLTALGLLLATHDASAGTLRVELESGAVVYGELISQVPGEGLQLQLPTGEIRKYGEAEIAKVTEREAEAEPDTVTVRIVANSRHAELVQVTGGRFVTTPIVIYGGTTPAYYGSATEEILETRTICRGSCEVPLAAAGLYKISGHGITDSSVFRMPQGQETLELRVDAGSSVDRTWGWVSMGIGVTSMLLGAAVLTTTGTEVERIHNGKVDFRETRMDPLIGYSMLGGGLALGVLGIWLVTSNSTDVTKANGVQLALGQSFQLTPSGLLF